MKKISTLPEGKYCSYQHWKNKFDDTDIIVVPWPILYWRFTENQGLLVLVQPACVFQTYELLLQQYFWLTVKYILLNYLKTFSYIHMADKSQAFLSVYCPSYCSSCVSHKSWSNYASNSAFSYTFGFPLRSLSSLSNSPFINFWNFETTHDNFFHLRQPHHIFLQTIDTPQLQISSNWRSKSKVPANHAYSVQNSTFSDTKEYIILIKIH